MCFGGGPSVPDPQAPPSPAPTVMPTDVSPIQTQQERTSKLASMRFGLASTITNKGGATGITGNGAELATTALYPTLNNKQTTGA
jgi:hypothetical protein